MYFVVVIGGCEQLMHFSPRLGGVPRCPISLQMFVDSWGKAGRYGRRSALLLVSSLPPRRWASSSMLVLESGRCGAIVLLVFASCHWPGLSRHFCGPPGGNFAFIVSYDHVL